MFMMANMNLENVDTFNAVFPWTQIEPSRHDSSGRSKNSAKLLQEKVMK